MVFEVGDEVEGRIRGSRAWQAAKVYRVRPNGTYDIEYVWGGNLRIIPFHSFVPASFHFISFRSCQARPPELNCSLCRAVCRRQHDWVALAFLLLTHSSPEFSVLYSVPPPRHPLSFDRFVLVLEFNCPRTRTPIASHW